MSEIYNQMTSSNTQRQQEEASGSAEEAQESSPQQPPVEQPEPQPLEVEGISEPLQYSVSEGGVDLILENSFEDYNFYFDSQGQLTVTNNLNEPIMPAQIGQEFGFDISTLTFGLDPNSALTFDLEGPDYSNNQLIANDPTTTATQIRLVHALVH